MLRKAAGLTRGNENQIIIQRLFMDGALEDLSEGPLLLEVAWEVARKVGGIYTVIRTKLPFMCNIWKDRYALVGVYCHERAATEFEPAEPRPLYAEAIRNLHRNNPGMRVHFGRWLVPGKRLFRHPKGGHEESDVGGHCRVPHSLPV